MKIHLLSRIAVMVDCWYAYFSGTPEVSVVCEDLNRFQQTHKVDCVVSPANSYGLMDGGFDLVIINNVFLNLILKVPAEIFRYC